MHSKEFIPIPKAGKKFRNINSSTQTILFAKSAGRCQICNRLVIKDALTQKDINLAEKAHIRAFSPGGARTDLNKLYLNTLDNLMLLCPTCHTTVDKQILEGDYTIGLLKQWKIDNERRIFFAGNVTKKTKVLKFAGNIGSDKVILDNSSVLSALLNDKLYSYDGSDMFFIDFTNTCISYSKTYWDFSRKEIDCKVDDFYRDFRRQNAGHVSIFAIGPIPLLMYFGSKLEDKISTKFFQRHRKGDSWLWEQKKPHKIMSLNC